jgi:hypothetical protein
MVVPYARGAGQAHAVVLVLFEGQAAPSLPFLRTLHWNVTTDPESEERIAHVIDAAGRDGARPSELWRRHTTPYSGLAVMTEADNEFFFGRTRETVEVIRALEASPYRLPVLLSSTVRCQTQS